MARCTNFEFFFGPERCERHILYGQIILLFRKIGKLIDCPQISMARRRIFWLSFFCFFFPIENTARPQYYVLILKLKQISISIQYCAIPGIGQKQRCDHNAPT